MWTAQHKHLHTSHLQFRASTPCSPWTLDEYDHKTPFHFSSAVTVKAKCGGEEWRSIKRDFSTHNNNIHGDDKKNQRQGQGLSDSVVVDEQHQRESWWHAFHAKSEAEKKKEIECLRQVLDSLILHDSGAVKITSANGYPIYSHGHLDDGELDITGIRCMLTLGKL